MLGRRATAKDKFATILSCLHVWVRSYPKNKKPKEAGPSVLEPYVGKKDYARTGNTACISGYIGKSDSFAGQ
ncbi:hypothetical protein MSSAC_2273 [Methanosarcina siciliae C2J]|uniref:Uncharacterized protein n=1 Tax=Methanosarcina siciliae C2J TaxID=1434118 RepID=A0A0E3PNY6_9EURY|nr:hypothetical protein MSSAC_2273 [Methanosarcina siciliae C2J]